ncbi:MAG: site-specific integrase [Bryobacteraceae bacterium]|nr:site-specific integrase [Bryobacteraceae bacterium]
MAVYRPTYTDPKTGKRVQSAVWWFNFTFAGKRYQESTKQTKKTLAQECEKQKRKALERALAGLPTEKPESRINSVSELVTKYLEHYPINHREKSVTFSKQRLAHVTRLLGKCLIPDLTENRVREYITTRLAEGAGGRTINMEFGELSRAVGQKWSVMWPKIRKLEENQEVGRALSPAEEQALLQTAANDQSPNRNRMLYTFLRIALSTGMRSGEIITLRWSQVDMADGVLTVGKAKTAKGTGRQIPLNDDPKAVLDMHAAWYAKQFGPIQPDWYVFPGRAGKPKAGESRPLDPKRPTTTIKTAWTSLRDNAGVQCRLHDLRHTAATKMAEAGVPESTMLAIMGHMSRAMLERYSHIRMAAKREAVKALMLPKVEPVSNPLAKESAKVNQPRAIQ